MEKCGMKYEGKGWQEVKIRGMSMMYFIMGSCGMSGCKTMDNAALLNTLNTVCVMVNNII